MAWRSSGLCHSIAHVPEKTRFPYFPLFINSVVEFIRTEIVLEQHGTLLITCQNRNFNQMGQIYNGNGATYGPILQAKAADYANTL